MAARYLVVIASALPGDGVAPDAAIERLLPADFALVKDTGRVRVYCEGGAACLVHASSLILGDVFARGCDRPSAALTDAEWSAIDYSRGERLISAYWGAYVAILAGHAEIEIVRAPFGELGCYYHQRGDSVFVASDLETLVAASGCRRDCDSEALARHIAFPDWRSPGTCLRGIGEVRGGDRLSVAHGAPAQTTIWSPWHYAHPDVQIADPHDAASRVRDAVQVAVRARTSGKRSLLLLSGGLDSSIVAAVLSSRGNDVVGMNLVANDVASDERYYARLVAEACGIDVAYRQFELAATDVRRSGAAHMPYPVHRCFTQALDAAAEAAAREYGAELIVDGGGGDNVFFGSRTVSIVGDCLLASGFDHRFWQTARALGDLAQTGIGTIVSKSIVRAWRRRAPRAIANLAFLSPAARSFGAAARHPWFEPPHDLPPGRASHVALLAPAQNMVEALQAQALYPSISPLASQPVIETCLKVPSWLWIAPGRNRAAARRAFEPDLPPAIVDRRSKGAPTSFVAAIFDRDRAAIREMLLGGALAELGLLDEKKVAEALGEAGPARGHDFVHVMGLVDAEAWLRAQRRQEARSTAP